MLLVADKSGFLIPPIGNTAPTTDHQNRFRSQYGPADQQCDANRFSLDPIDEAWNTMSTYRNHDLYLGSAYIYLGSAYIWTFVAPFVHGLLPRWSNINNGQEEDQTVS